MFRLPHALLSPYVFSQRGRSMCVTLCVRGDVGVQAPASVRPASLFSVALSVWSSVTSIRGKSVCVSVCVLNQ